jgi:hypothetical protein
MPVDLFDSETVLVAVVDGLRQSFHWSFHCCLCVDGGNKLASANQTALKAIIFSYLALAVKTWMGAIAGWPWR